MAKRPSYYRPVFDIFAPLYDLGVWLIGLPLGGEKNLRRLAIEAVNPAADSRVLEICCGTGTISIMAAKKGALAYGLDISRGMLDVAREKAGREKVKVGLVQSDTATLPFKTGAFDRVIASMGLHEMPFDVARGVFQEIKRILKNNGGRFIIFDYHKGEGAAGMLQKIFFIFAEHGAAKEFINADMQKELRDAGFKGFQRRFLAKGTLQVVTAEI